MTTAVFELIGHRLRLSAEGDVLTACRWTDENILASEPSDSDEAVSSIIEKTKLQLKEYTEGKRRDFDLPIRPEGTEFRIKVWEELRRIPYGETITYGELARRVGNPKAYRAVANACGANPIPIIIPCHRVVASRGKTGGYTGGLDIKLTLLGIENKTLSGALSNRGHSVPVKARVRQLCSVSVIWLQMTEYHNKSLNIISL